MSYLALRLVVLMRDAPSSVTGFARATFPPKGWKARTKPSPFQGADFPCQGEMSRSDKRGREGAPVGGG